ncbi:MAG: hydroxymethylbilane synthase [Opitutales bacterium]|nr:hydroxymethylbilane synthase [Opitutales bacterium]
MNIKTPVRLATRKSPLAICQSEIVANLIRSKMGLEVELLLMSTTGDQRLEWSLQKKGGKGLFTKELEQALLDGRADLAVHSAKDMPTENPDGLVLSAFLKREDPRDVLVIRSGLCTIEKIASGSPRRTSQLKARFPSAQWMELRGNVESRLRKIAENHEADGTILAAAGLNRLQIKEFEGVDFEVLPVDQMVPAPGQGAIAIQTRLVDREKFSVLGDPPTEAAVGLERKILEGLGGGCQVAIGAHVQEGMVYFYHQATGIIKIEMNGKTDEELVRDLVERTK